MLSSQEKEPPPQTSAPSPERAFRIETSFRISILGVASVACMVILLLLSVAVYAGFNAMLRPLVTLLGIAAAFASLLSRGHIRVGWRRTADPPDDIRAMLPEGAKKVYDLNDLPPDLANNPEVRRLFERAGGRGAWVKIDSPSHSSVAASDSMARRAENALSGDLGHVQPARVEKRMARITFRVSANSVLNTVVVWAASLVIFAALAAAVVAWMSLKAGSPAH